VLYGDTPVGFVQAVRTRRTTPAEHPMKSPLPLRYPMHTISSAQVSAFRKKVLSHYARHGRDLPWRKRVTPYRVLVSEIMLQQTQVERVIEKYREFIAAFPSFPALAKASTSRLLRGWSGLGYNRRALALRDLARKVMADHRGRLPSDPEALRTLPGIGPYTAGAVAAFAFDQPVLFIDTNIRRVFIHEFFAGHTRVRDEELAPLIERAMDRRRPGRWYNALMDYGTMLKQQHGNANHRSAHYSRQSPFENSNRQLRGAILKALLTGSAMTAGQMAKHVRMDAERVRTNLLQLEAEGFIRKKGGKYTV
jgi:A/G-specific adenine glycosylase